MAPIVMVRAAAGPTGNAALARHIRKYPALTYRPGKPISLVNFGESVSFPLLLGVALSLFGAATMLRLLLVSVAGRRHEAGLLKVGRGQAAKAAPGKPPQDGRMSSTRSKPTVRPAAAPPAQACCARLSRSARCDRIGSASSIEANAAGQLSGPYPMPRSS